MENELSRIVLIVSIIALKLVSYKKKPQIDFPYVFQKFRNSKEIFEKFKEYKDLEAYNST